MSTLEEYEVLKSENEQLRRELAQLQRPVIDATPHERKELKHKLVAAYLGPGPQAVNWSPASETRFERQVNVVISYAADLKKAAEEARSARSVMQREGAATARQLVDARAALADLRKDRAVMAARLEQLAEEHARAAARLERIAKRKRKRSKRE